MIIQPKNKPKLVNMYTKTFEVLIKIIKTQVIFYLAVNIGVGGSLYL